jgi:hypothetical protein
MMTRPRAERLEGQGMEEGGLDVILSFQRVSRPQESLITSIQPNPSRHRLDLPILKKRQHGNDDGAASTDAKDSKAGA